VAYNYTDLLLFLLELCGYLAKFIRKGVMIFMKVVVKKSPKFLRGFLKLIFGIKGN